MKRAILLWLVALNACGRGPPETVEAMGPALSSGDLPAFLALVSGGYTDPRGDREVLGRELGVWLERYPHITLTHRELVVEAGRSALAASVSGAIEADLRGTPGLKIDGYFQYPLEKDGDFRVRTGLFDAPRDVVEVLEARAAALEANDPAALSALLHPAYRDGDLNREDVQARLQRDLSDVRVRYEVTHRRLELRPDLVHADELHVLTVNGRPTGPQVARITLRPTAGRYRIAAGLYRE